MQAARGRPRPPRGRRRRPSPHPVRGGRGHRGGVAAGRRRPQPVRRRAGRRPRGVGDSIAACSCAQCSGAAHSAGSPSRSSRVAASSGAGRPSSARAAGSRPIASSPSGCSTNRSTGWRTMASRARGQARHERAEVAGPPGERDLSDAAQELVAGSRRAPGRAAASRARPRRSPRCIAIQPSSSRCRTAARGRRAGPRPRGSSTERRDVELAAVQRDQGGQRGRGVRQQRGPVAGSSSPRRARAGTTRRSASPRRSRAHRAPSGPRPRRAASVAGQQRRGRIRVSDGAPSTAAALPGAGGAGAPFARPAPRPATRSPISAGTATVGATPPEAAAIQRYSSALRASSPRRASTDPATAPARSASSGSTRSRAPSTASDCARAASRSPARRCASARRAASVSGGLPARTASA